MKKIERNIYTYEESDFFKPIRSKIDYIRIILLTIRKILLIDLSPALSEPIILRMIIDKSSRVYFYNSNKFFSISFPFKISENDEGSIEVRSTKTDNIIDNKIISEALQVINTLVMSENQSFIDYSLMISDEDGVSIKAINFIEYLLFVEPAYFRYDYDPKTNGDIHPLHHLDINYSTYGTYKLGLRKGIDQLFFEDLQDIQTACRYIDH